MDWFHSARRSCRTLRRRRTCSPMLAEVLEERTLLSLTLIKDINPAPLFPAEITGAGANVYFVTEAADGGSDLDVKTATGTALLKEFAGADSSISHLTPDGSKLFFYAELDQGEQLWVTSGTSAGTKLIKKTDPSGRLGDPTVAGNELYFAFDASRASKNTPLFKSNGTAAGTVPVAMPAGPFKSGHYPDNLVNDGGVLYFDIGDELMKSEGATTKVVSTFARSVNNLTDAGGVLYFTTPDAANQGVDLYASNGTARGTTLLKDFNNGSLINPNLAYYSPVSNFTAVGTKLFFAADDTADGPSLWVSDGTQAGTAFLKALGEPLTNEPADAGSAGPPILASAVDGSRLFFTTEPSAPGGGTELWVSDGTAAGTTQLALVDPGNTGPYSSSNGQFAALYGKLFFANDDPAHGVELWQSDGTAAGTGLFLDLNPGAAGSFPGNMAVINNTLYFSATTAAGSSALWSSNGTATGTNAVATFESQPDGDAIFNNTRDAFAVLGGTMVFPADDGTNQTELWKTDGTASGTTMIKVLAEGPLGYAYGPSDFTTVGGTAFFVTHGTTESLWVTDGTTAGTTKLATFDGTFLDLTAFGEKLAFIESTPDDTNYSLWVSDGTASGTTQVTSFLNLGQNYSPEAPTMAALDGKLYISAPPLPGPDVTGFDTLWESDGTADGTTPIAGVPVSSNVDSLVVFEGKLYFSVDFPRTQLWVTDGTADGTRRVANVGPDTGLASTDVGGFLVAGPNLYIVTSSTGTNGKSFEGLYKWNETANRPVLIHSFMNGSSVASAGLPNGDLALDVSGTSSNPMPQLWLSNGTAKGTTQVKDVRGGFGYLATGDFYAGDGAISSINGLFYLQGTDSKHGTELWRSDGTVAGTTLVQDLNPGTGSSYPMALAELNGNLIVAANDGTHGVELLSGPIPAGPAGPAAVKPEKPSPIQASLVGERRYTVASS
jgi:ELWxxDGT repeat protein